MKAMQGCLKIIVLLPADLTPFSYTLHLQLRSYFIKVSVLKNVQKGDVCAEFQKKGSLGASATDIAAAQELQHNMIESKDAVAASQEIAIDSEGQVILQGFGILNPSISNDSKCLYYIVGSWRNCKCIAYPQGITWKVDEPLAIFCLGRSPSNFVFLHENQSGSAYYWSFLQEFLKKFNQT